MSEDLTGQTLGSYKLVALVGSGHISSVCRGYDNAEDRYATLKVLPTEFLTEPGFLERFRHEVRYLAELTHSAIVAPSDVGAAHGRPYLVLPSMPDGSLVGWALACALVFVPIGAARGPVWATIQAAILGGPK